MNWHCVSCSTCYSCTVSLSSLGWGCLLSHLENPLKWLPKWHMDYYLQDQLPPQWSTFISISFFRDSLQATPSIKHAIYLPVHSCIRCLVFMTVCCNRLLERPKYILLGTSMAISQPCRVNHVEFFGVLVNMA